MKLLLLAACIIGMAFSAPPQKYMEFDIHHAPPQAAQAIPAGAPVGSLEVLLPVNDQRQVVGGPVQGFIKQEIPRANGKDDEIYYPFGFNLPDPAAAAPAAAAPAAPAAAAPVAPAAPAAPVEHVVIVAEPVAKPSDDDEEDD
ncbi:secretory calcium-binding phosphoprotein 7 [Fundulus heteroclitus]|uniref:secretory calcium-binding phosphoprotein 7 n=1 Tax=Fundulus heteroclitus TaxID=8078 RepID=UPI00165B25D3|nr:secretory calcium-binding phosphoprotein 7 [Fundulus heteroclitus]